MEVESLEKIKIHELAKKLGVETKKVLDTAKETRIGSKKPFEFYYRGRSK